MHTSLAFSLREILALTAGGALLWIGSVILYRRYLHPLAGIPGPAIPSMTRLYYWWYNAHSFKFIEACHDRYGPVVRIAPNEVHLSDPINYEKIYSVGYKFKKDPAVYMAFRGPTLFNTTSPEIHRQTRAPLNPFFSRKSVLKQQEIVWDKVNLLCSRMQDAGSAGAPFDLYTGLRAVAMDVISEYAYGHCWDQLRRRDLGIVWTKLYSTLGSLMHTAAQFPRAVTIISRVIPDKVTSKLNQGFAEIEAWMTKSHQDLVNVKRDMDNGVSPKRTTIFHEMMEYGIRDIDRLKMESLALMGGASETVGNALTVIVFNVITNQQILAEIQKELAEAYPDPTMPMDFKDLENLPYLTATVKEGLRLSYGAICRLPRRVPKGGVNFNGYFIPENTTIGMSSWMMHRNAKAFPNPDKFDPARWTVHDELTSLRQRCFVPFSSGSQSCIGQELARVEIYCTAAAIFRRFDKLKTWNVGPEDMVYEDKFEAMHPSNARRLKVLVA
ncbi:cytochrome P450 [Xylariales sp. PMI_506]|nr:cytochrome P450 [Xylariales sp. PMI_506]